MSNAERAREILDAFALGDYLDTLPRILVTDENRSRIPHDVCGWWWDDHESRKRYWSAEPLIVQAVARTIGATVLPPPNKPSPPSAKPDGL